MEPPRMMSTGQLDIEPVTKCMNVKKGSRKVIGVLREHYLRSDLSCRSAICFEPDCHQLNSSCRGSLLSKDLTHYIVPLADVAMNFLDILEFAELTGILFLQTVVNVVQLNHFRQYQKICSLIRDLSKGSIFFPNEFFKSTHCPRRNDENIRDWQTRACFETVIWYYDHLGGQKPFVILTENAQIIKKYGVERLEVFVMTLGEYLNTFMPKLTTAMDVYRSISAAQVDQASESHGPREQMFEDHWKSDLIDSGLKKGSLVQGRLRVSKHHSMVEAFLVCQGGSDTVSSGDNDSEDILIPGQAYRNRAIDGDIVAVQVLPKSQWKSKINRLSLLETKTSEKRDGCDLVDADEDCIESIERHEDVVATGKVVGIIQRNWKNLVAAIQPDTVGELGGNRRILVVPFDRRYPKVRLMTSQAQNLMNHRIVVKIDNWPANSKYPNGHFVKVLGKIGDLEAEIKVFLVTHDIDERIGPFSQGVMSEMPTEDWKPEQAEVDRRKDFRSSHLVMSIDPEGCQDVDDALSVRTLPNGNIQLGVYIADVSYFVRPDSLTDHEARRRATTVYLADRRYDMLPPVLSANVCSLLSGQDRYAVAVIWELDQRSHDVLGVWYGRTVIRSAFKLSYETAQAILDGSKSDAELATQHIHELSSVSEKAARTKLAHLRDALIKLSKVARSIQTRRQLGGALRLEGAEVQFEFQGASLENIRPKEHLVIHETVAECMILANQFVARKIAQSFPDAALLRRHPQPKLKNFEALKACAASKGWHIETWSNKALADSLDKCTDAQDPLINFVLRGLATQAMVEAAYFSTGHLPENQWEHYGLALDKYTHFTSPIRRYADIIVHRLLMAALDRQDWWCSAAPSAPQAPGALPSNGQLQQWAAHINERNRAAQLAQRDSQTLFQTLYFRDKSPDDPRCIATAIIFSLKCNGFLIYVPKYGLKGAVYLLDSSKNQVLWLSAKSGPTWKSGVIRQNEFDLSVETLESGRQTYRLFDHVRVVIQLRHNQDYHPNTLVYHLLTKCRKSGLQGSSDLAKKADINFLQELRLKKERQMRHEQNDDDQMMAVSMTQLRLDNSSAYSFFSQMRHLSHLPAPL